MNHSALSKLCVVIQAKTLDEFLAQLLRVQMDAPWVELRVDALERLDEATLTQIRAHTKRPAVFCFRHDHLPTGKAADRWISLYQQADKLGFSLLDMDLCCQTLWENRSWHTAQLISYHNYTGTPDDAELSSILKQLRSHKAAVIKLATYANTSTDLQRLYRLLLEKPPTENWIITGMGDVGKILRILGLFLGNYLSYAANGDQSSAPGQLDYHAMQRIFQMIQQTLN